MRYTYIFILIIFLISYAHADTKFYSRLGDLSELAEIYLIQGKDKIFLDASSLPSEYRVRITKKLDGLKKIDMTEVKKGKKTTTNGAVIYDMDWYAPSQADLFQFKDNKTFLVLDSISKENQEKVTTSDRFTHIGKANIISKDKAKELEIGLNELLSNFPVNTTYDLKKYGTQDVAKAFEKYRTVINEKKGKVIKAIEDEMKQLIEKADLNGVKEITALKESFIRNGDTSALTDIKDYGIKRSVSLFNKAREKEQEKLNKTLEKEMKEQMKKGSLSIAELINNLKNDIPTEKDEPSNSKKRSKSKIATGVVSLPTKKVNISIDAIPSRSKIDKIPKKYFGLDYVINSWPSKSYTFTASSDGLVFVIITEGQKTKFAELKFSSTKDAAVSSKGNPMEIWGKVVKKGESLKIECGKYNSIPLLLKKE